MPVHALLGSWATRKHGQLGVVEGGERGRGAGRRTRPSAVIPGRHYHGRR